MSANGRPAADGAADERPGSITVRELQHLAAAMAHEVRNPLNSMAIHAELLEGRLKRGLEVPASPQDREAALKSVAVLAHEIERIDRILDEFLRFAGPAEAARRPIAPARLLAEAVARARAAAETRGVEFRIEAAPKEVEWAIDGEAIGEALDAALANAVEASPRGETIEVIARSDGEQAELVVRDHGEGLARDDLARAFQIGFSRRGRAGLGLTVAKQIVKGHGGSIALVSEGLGNGSTLVMRLPLESETDGDELD